MILYILSYLGGALTIVSPCILPVLPFVFARTGRPFLTNGLPMLVGMAAMFALVATLAAVGGGWAVQANQYGRWLALVLLTLFGVTMLFPSLSARMTQPLVGLGARLSDKARAEGAGIGTSLLLGVATGLLWAPCAGPILGLVLTGAALKGASGATTLLLVAYAAGAATSLALALVIGGRVFGAMKRSLGLGEWVRRVVGACVLVAVVGIALGVDTGFLSRVSQAGTSRLEQTLLDRFHMAQKPVAQDNSLAVEGAMPSIDGAVQWLNSPPLTREGLKGKVVVVDFWTYSCINCLRSLPYVKAWAAKYHDQGLVVIGVHAPEFAFERDIGNVTRAVHDLGITYPVAIDNNYAIWRAFNNGYWPAHYFIDAKGQIRHHSFGEGDYAADEHVIQTLLAEANGGNVPTGTVDVAASGIQATSNQQDVESPETYIGYGRAERFISPGGARKDRPATYRAHPEALDAWGLEGDWTVGEEHASLDHAGGRITYRFHARDLHLVLGPGADGKPVRFRVTIDGKAPGAAHGVDTDSDGQGVVREQRLYQLVRQHGDIKDHTFTVEFQDSGVQAFAFTFG
jgi:cytochrome c biogenesis protein CcdA/thiol-disulfide isomerase/thioredoxin